MAKLMTKTERQDKNGTIEWQLPIKNNWPNSDPEYIRVASFASGYVRNQNSGYSNYQLNKRCMSEPTYYPSHKWVDGKQVPDGKYYKFQTRGCKLIPIEIERLEYMLEYCIKNYYIKHANQVPNGDYVPKWRYEFDMENAAKDTAHAVEQWQNKVPKVSVIVNGQKYNVT